MIVIIILVLQGIMHSLLQELYLQVWLLAQQLTRRQG